MTAGHAAQEQGKRCRRVMIPASHQRRAEQCGFALNAVAEAAAGPGSVDVGTSIKKRRGVRRIVA